MIWLISIVLPLQAFASAELFVVENGLEPWPSGHGEHPPPIGSLISLNQTGHRQVVS